MNSFENKLKPIRHYGLKLLISVFHAAFLVVLTILLQYSTLTRSDELNFTKWFYVIKYDLMGIDPKPEQDIVFVDVAKDLSIIDDPELLYSGAKIAIKDRKKLAQFFSEANKNTDGYKYIICDILFEDSSPDDVQLKPVIEKTRRLIVPSTYQNGHEVRPVFNVDYGNVNYLVDHSHFTKTALILNSTTKTLPVKIYENTTGNLFSEHNSLTYFKDRLAFNTLATEMYFRASDLRRESYNGKPANLFYLGDLILHKDFFKDFLKDKFIIIGDFSNDMHATNIGSLPGCLILLNSYLTLVNHQPFIEHGWIGILFFIYLTISVFMFLYPNKKIIPPHEGIKIPFLKDLILKYFSFLGIVIVIGLISYCFYSVFISIFYIATYLTFLKMAIENYPIYYAKIKKILRLRTMLFSCCMLLFLNAESAFGQPATYSVSAVKGKIYYEGNLVAPGNTVTDMKKLTAENKDAKIRLLNPIKGSFVISFVNGKMIENPQIQKNAELYEITIHTYIEGYTTQKALTTKGNFDWGNFFTHAHKTKLMLFEDQYFLLKGRLIQVDSSARFVATVFTQKDSSDVKLERTKDTLHMKYALFPNHAFLWKLKMHYVENRQEQVIDISQHISSTFVTNNELKDIVAFFLTGREKNHTDKKVLKAEIIGYLEYNYGAYYKPDLDLKIDGYIANLTK